MPLYDRRCARCDAVFTHLCKVEDRNEPKICPNCDCLETVAILSPTRTNFKFADASANKRVRE